jgi:photosystem II stability/assembly factor-like uncharacterized protein
MKKTLTFLLLICTLQSWAQWIQTGPEGGAFFIREHNGILYSTTAIGLYKSTDNGSNWARISTLAGFTMRELEFASNKMLAATDKGLFYSLDTGITWVSSNQGLTSSDTTGLGTFFIYKTNNGRLITSAVSGTYFSDNNGQNWTISAGGVTFNAVCQQANIVYGLGSNGILQSTDNGQTWTASSSIGVSAGDIFSMVKIFSINNILIIGCNSASAYTSVDNGQNWNLVPIGNLTGNNQGSIYSFNNSIFKKTSSGYFTLNFTNNIWETNNITQTNDITILGYNNGRFIGANAIFFDNVVCSDNNGLSWQNTDGIKCMNIKKYSLTEYKYVLGDGAAFLFDTNIVSFTRVSPYNQNFSANTYAQYSVLDIKKRSNGTIYLGTPGGVWKSTNNGASYTQSYNGLPALGVTQTRNVYDMYVAGSFPNDTLYAATDDGIYYSIDDAQTFMLCAGTSGAKMQQFLKYDGVLYCAGTKIYKLNTGNSWSQFAIINTTGILGFAATAGYLFVAITNNTLKYAPINGSASFAPITSGSPGFAYSVAAYDTLVFYYNETGVWKLNTSLLGSATPADLVQIAPDLPFYRIPSQAKRYSYLSNGFSMAVFNGKLWLGTNGMSTYYRSLNDFGYNITVNVNEIKTSKQSLVFPNPAKDKITFPAFEKGCQVSIFNSSGQIVITKICVESQTIDISKLNTGIYTYSIIDTKVNMIDHGKFVKE